MRSSPVRQSASVATAGEWRNPSFPQGWPCDRGNAFSLIANEADFRIWSIKINSGKDHTKIQMTNVLNMPREEILRIELETKKREHRDLDEAIAALHENTRPDMLTLQRLKRKKLALKDKIRRLENEITPDIIA